MMRKDNVTGRFAKAIFHFELLFEFSNRHSNRALQLRHASRQLQGWSPTAGTVRFRLQEVSGMFFYFNKTKCVDEAACLHNSVDALNRTAEIVSNYNLFQL